MKKRCRHFIFLFLYGGTGNRLFQILEGIRRLDDGVAPTLILCPLLPLKGEGQQILDSVLPDGLHTKRISTSVARVLNILAICLRIVTGTRAITFTGIKVEFLKGYFQYFDDIDRLTSQGLFSLNLHPQPIPECVVVHYRGGDFKHNRFLESHGAICDQGYYQAADDRFDSELPRRIVTDGRLPTDAEDMLPVGEIADTDNSELMDFRLMMGARYVICSNSTFCAWAIVLGALMGYEKVIVTPKERVIGHEYFDMRIDGISFA